MQFINYYSVFLRHFFFKPFQKENSSRAIFFYGARILAIKIERYFVSLPSITTSAVYQYTTSVPHKYICCNFIFLIWRQPHRLPLAVTITTHAIRVFVPKNMGYKKTFSLLKIVHCLALVAICTPKKTLHYALEFHFATIHKTQLILQA